MVNLVILLQFLKYSCNVQLFGMQRAQLFSHISNDSLFSLASFLGMSFICRPLENFLFVIINNKLHRMRNNSLICFGLPLLLTIVMFTYLHLHLELISFNVL